jgi:hypothetical protein
VAAKALEVDTAHLCVCMCVCVCVYTYIPHAIGAKSRGVETHHLLPVVVFLVFIHIHIAI